MNIKKIILLSLIPYFYGFSSICYFVPPKNWRCADPTKLSKYVNIGFVGKSKNSFNPSINLAEEKTEATLDEYVKAIKDSHKNEKETTVREIGKITNQIDGKSILLEISKPSTVGEIKILQSVTKKDQSIYVLTGAVLKEELLNFKEDFFTSFKSLKITDNIAFEASSIGKASELQSKLSYLKQKKISIKEFEKHVEENYQPLGNYWKILVLKQAYADLKEN